MHENTIDKKNVRVGGPTMCAYIHTYIHTCTKPVLSYTVCTQA